MKLGTTFSHRHANYLGMNSTKCLRDVIDLGFDCVRLCVYWSEVQPRGDIFDFSEITRQLEICQQKKQAVILSVGMKAPRWPEFYIPEWAEGKNHDQLSESVLQFLRKTVESLGEFSCIQQWQVENEPLDPSGERNRTVPIEILEREVELVRSLDPRPIVLTAWGNAASKRGNFLRLASTADIIGVDLYYQQFVNVLGIHSYHGPQDSDEKLRALFEKVGSPVWITEIQAEPWESDEAGYRSATPKSMSPKLLEEFFQRVKQLSVDAVLFWGVEYWLWRATQGDMSYLELWGKMSQGKL